MNPAHYTAWQFRYETLMALNSPLEDELHLMDSIAKKHMKTYQVWHHRRLLVTKLGAPMHESELKLIGQTLALDSKNYHTWSYRQWIVASFPVEYDRELQWVENMITQDIRNNSAWHHRFFLVFLSGACNVPLEERTNAEISFVRILHYHDVYLLSNVQIYQGDYIASPIQSLTMELLARCAGIC
jgi:hypothetical protein